MIMSDLKATIFEIKQIDDERENTIQRIVESTNRQVYLAQGFKRSVDNLEANWMAKQKKRRTQSIQMSQTTMDQTQIDHESHFMRSTSNYDRRTSAPGVRSTNKTQFTFGKAAINGLHSTISRERCYSRDCCQPDFYQRLPKGVSL